MKLGIASCVKPMSFLIDKASTEIEDQNPVSAFLTTAKDYAKERSLDILSVMTAFNIEKQFQRELFVWAMTPAQSSSAARRFEELAGKELDLKTFTGADLTVSEQGGDEWRKAWAQAGLQHSRKRVAPLLRDAMGRL